MLPASVAYGVQKHEAQAYRATQSNLLLDAARECLAVYLNATGIETGYGFFAPAVSSNFKLVFELHYRDGRTEAVLPVINNRGSSVRVVTLLDRLMHIEDARLRELIVRMLADSVCHEDPEVIKIRAVLGAVNWPALEQFRHGEKESYETIFAYDFVIVPRNNDASP